MPFILCPECNKKRESKLVGEHTLQSWLATYGLTPAPITCFDANLANACVRKHEAKLQEEKNSKVFAEYHLRRRLALTPEEADLVLKAFNTLDVPPTVLLTSLEKKIQDFLDGDKTHQVLE